MKRKTKFASLIKLTALSPQEKYSGNDLVSAKRDTGLEEINRPEVFYGISSLRKQSFRAHVPYRLRWQGTTGLRREAGKKPTSPYPDLQISKHLIDNTKNRCASYCKWNYGC